MSLGISDLIGSVGAAGILGAASYYLSARKSDARDREKLGELDLTEASHLDVFQHGKAYGGQALKELRQRAYRLSRLPRIQNPPPREDQARLWARLLFDLATAAGLAPRVSVELIAEFLATPGGLEGMYRLLQLTPEPTPRRWTTWRHPLGGTITMPSDRRLGVQGSAFGYAPWGRPYWGTIPRRSINWGAVSRGHLSRMAVAA